MNCRNCSTELPAGAKFCHSCGTKVESSRGCGQCGAVLKPAAKFCHKCGQPVTGEVAGQAAAAAASRNGSGGRNVLATVGLVLFIPIVAIGIISLLFWKNQEPVPLQPSSAAEGGVPSMAAMEQVHETLDRLKKNIEANPEDLVSLDSLAIMYSIAGSYDKARKYYERHLEIEPDNKDVRIALGLTYHNLNRSEEALSLMQEILDGEPDYAFALFYKGDILAQTGRVEQAEESWKRVVEKYPGTEIAKMAEQRIHDLTHIEGGASN